MHAATIVLHKNGLNNVNEKTVDFLADFKLNRDGSVVAAAMVMVVAKTQWKMETQKQ